MRPAILPAVRPGLRVGNPLRSGVGRYAVLFVGLGAAGVVIGWAGPDAPGVGRLIRRR
ncbi:MULTISPECIES: hypothetical protein [Thermomonospora]|uniref:Uncharacterized protein n=1 Tax=Thermomonospora cellulosilytica TaxID=1411118 RepID=A0A7W3N227_9ACTN|nr:MULTISPECIES: hypothetical protein [Thermomonospora]MBA9006130.1 hypothetical protein [Thermomonospora cellulosilytica]